MYEVDYTILEDITEYKVSNCLKEKSRKHIKNFQSLI